MPGLQLHHKRIAQRLKNSFPVFMRLIEPVGTKGFTYSVTRFAADCSALIPSRCLADSH